MISDRSVTEQLLFAAQNVVTWLTESNNLFSFRYALDTLCNICAPEEFEEEGRARRGHRVRARRFRRTIHGDLLEKKALMYSQ